MCALSYLLGVPVTFPATAFFKKLKRCSLYNQVNFWCIYYIFCINNCLICWLHAYFLSSNGMLHSKVLHTIVSSSLHKCMLAHFAHVSVLFQRSIALLVPRFCQSECAADVMKKQLFDAARPLMCGHCFFLIFFVGLRLWSQEERKRLWILLHHVHLITVLCLQCIFNQATILLLVYSGNELLDCLLVALLWLLSKPLYTVLLKLLGECYYHAWARCPSSIPLQSWIGVE